MTKTWTASITAVGALLLTGCGTADPQESNAAETDTVAAVSTFSVLTDIVEEIGGEHVEVHNLVPVGQDPHEYESSPADTTALSDADVFFSNGLNLEGGDAGWAARMVDSVGFDEQAHITVSEGVEPLYLTDDDNEDAINPHAFLDPNVGVVMAENVAEGLAQVDPDNAADYEANVDDYVSELQAMDEQYQQQLGDLDEERRVLVTSERAFQYVADQYDIEEGYIWAVDTDEIGTPDQIISTIEFVNEYEPPALFVESNVTPAPMETVSDETGVEIHGTVYSDELAPEGEPGDTYLGLLEENLTTISEGLQQ